MGRACRSLPWLMTCAHTQELQRTLPGARRISFADESGVKLWARSQWTKAIDGDAAAHERKSPTRRTGRGLCQLLFQAGRPAQTGQVLMLMLTNGGDYAIYFQVAQGLFAARCYVLIQQAAHPLWPAQL